MTWREPPSNVPDDPDIEEGEPDTVDDEFAKPDAPEQSYEDDV